MKRATRTFRLHPYKAISALALLVVFPLSVCSDEDRHARAKMVEEDIGPKARNRPPVTDAKVLAAMGKVERHKFVPARIAPVAYADRPWPIGHGQTISQPYIVAYMTEQLKLEADDVVLEIGTGSGYQAAVLAEIVKQVYTIEIVRPLGEEAKARLKALGYKNVEVRIGDGYQGWPEHAPFDAIIVTAAPENIPPPLVEQLKPGGRMVIPVGPQSAIQQLRIVEKEASGAVKEKDLMPVGFVPFTRESN